MAATLALDPLAVEDPCQRIHPRCERIVCSREDGHKGCHWGRLNPESEHFVVWQDGISILRPVLKYWHLANICGENDTE